ncbi:repair protein PSO2 SNM1 [Dipsacomyces acuminosporus]|nr:repair protein PSO2 SNM1 [Dipsacomyces acuminosporus]
MTEDKIQFHVNCCLDNAVLEAKKQQKQKHKLPKETSLQQQQQQIKTEEDVPKQVARHSTIEKVSIDDMFNEIEQVPFTVEAKATDACAFVYDHPKPSTGPELTKSISTGKVSKRQPLPLPPYKRMPGTAFTVDAFKYGLLDFCTGYFLTHFHSDHYGGLTKGFKGEIYCSRITANLIKQKIGTDPSKIHPLPMNTRCMVQGIYVTLIDAMHCPGAVLFLFEVPQENDRLVRIVHTGDFRASERHVQEILHVFRTGIDRPITPDNLRSLHLSKPAANYASPMIDYVYLDTTYLEPTYSFPPQRHIVGAVGEFCYRVNADSEYLPSFLNRLRNGTKSTTASMDSKRLPERPSLITRWFRPNQRALASDLKSPAPQRRRILFVVGTYTIGKEKLFVEIAHRLNSKIYIAADKRRILECIQSPSLTSLLTDNMGEAQVHAVSMNMVNMRGMAEYLSTVQAVTPSFSRIVAFNPTGWSHAGPFIPGHAHQPSPIRPQKVPEADMDTVPMDNDYSRSIGRLLALSARISDEKDAAFTIDALKPRGSSDKITIFPVPYSEHSSFTDLARFVCSLKIGQVIPTVYSTSDKNHKAANWLDHWQELKQVFESKVGVTSPSPSYPDDEFPLFC